MGSCAAAAKAAGVSEHDFRPDGGESWSDVEERAADFWRFLLSKHASSLENVQPVHDTSCADALTGSKLPHVIIVTHSGFIQSLLSNLTHSGALPQLEQTKGVMHASLTTLYVHPTACLRLLRTNDVAHLKGLARTVRAAPTQDSALKAKSKPMKRSVASSPSRPSLIEMALVRRRPSASEERLDDRPIPAAASPPPTSLLAPSSPPLARSLPTSPTIARATPPPSAAVPISVPEVLL